MEISFKKNKLKKQFEDENKMTKAFGDRAGRLQMRLSTLMAASCLADISSDPPDCCHPLSGQRNEQFAITITKNWRLIFEVDHEDIPLLEDGGINLEAVTKICIVEVVDYHGE